MGRQHRVRDTDIGGRAREEVAVSSPRCVGIQGPRPTCPSGSPAGYTGRALPILVCPPLQLGSPHAALGPAGRQAQLEGTRQAPRKPF